MQPLSFFLSFCSPAAAAAAAAAWESAGPNFPLGLLFVVGSTLQIAARATEKAKTFLATRRWLERERDAAEAEEDFIFWGCFQSFAPLGVRAICPRWELCVRCNFNLVENWGG
jgi:hypothetical protein